jgi:hypothetical protein
VEQASVRSDELTPDSDGRLIVAPRPYIEPAPVGRHDAVCVDYINEPQVMLNGYLTNCVRLVWQLSVRTSCGMRHIVSRRFAKRMTHNAGLRMCLERWRGKAFTGKESSEVYLEAYIGRPCLLTIAHDTWKNGTTWVDVVQVEPWDWDVKRHALEAEGYVRRCDRTLRGRA